MTLVSQFPEILIRNSFNVLGLSPSATLKEIRKRSQELLQLAKIEEIQEFEVDIGHVKEFRRESEIRLALERISGIQGRLKEIFFWFVDHRLDNQKALEHISKGNFQKALDIFDSSNSDWLDKKNLALTLMIQAFAFSSLEALLESLAIWKLIIDSDEFWEVYKKYYLLHDELDTSTVLFEEFRSSLFEVLSTIVASFYHQTKGSKAIGAFYSVFGRIGKAIDTEILNPTIQKVKNEINALEEMQASHFESFTIQKILEKVRRYFAELDKFGLENFSPLIILKNDTSQKLRSIAIDIYNQDGDNETAGLLLKCGSEIAISEDIQNTIAYDQKQLSKNEAWQSISQRFDEIETLITNRRFEEAKSLYLQVDNTLMTEATEAAANNRIQLLVTYSSILMTRGHELAQKREFGIRILAISGFLNRYSQKDGIRAFSDALEIINDRLYLFNFIEAKSNRDKLSQTVDTISKNLRNCELTSLIDRHESSLQEFENIADEQTNDETQTIIKFLGAALCYSILYQRLYELTQRKMWKWIGWTAASLFYFFVVMGDDKPASNTSHKTSSYKTKTSSSYGLTAQEEDTIEWMDILFEDGLKNLRKKGYSDRQIAQAILEKMKSAGYSDVGDYLLDLEEKS